MAMLCLLIKSDLSESVVWLRAWSCVKAELHLLYWWRVFSVLTAPHKLFSIGTEKQTSTVPNVMAV